ncbi:MAG: peptidase M50 [Chromatiaceae bacterium]|nr:peptidase M50 [Chromatiaceae bacterium]
MNHSGPQTTPLWTQLSGLRPRLRSHITWHRQTHRGHDWILLEDRATNRHYHLTEPAWRLLQRLDGERSVAQALACAWLTDELTAARQQEAVELLRRLQAANLLVYPENDPSNRLYEQWRKQRTRSHHAQLMRPLALRLPLFDPTPLLQRLAPLARPLFHWSSLLIWITLVLLAVVLGLQHGSALSAHAEGRFIDPGNLALLWLAYPLVKGLHELGHALAIHRWGGQVHELGLMLLVFVPVPYVEASAATAFPGKYQRILVGAAGIMVELLVSALALLLWLAVEPGWVRDLAFDLCVIGGVSALLFNGNPLLRFDGYYVFSDLLEIPNLASRAQHYYAYLGQRYLLGLRSVTSPVVARGERGWFLCYGAAAFLYRIFISLVITLYVAGKFFVVGLLLALWVVLSQLLLPLLRLLRYLFCSPELAERRSRAVLLAVVFASSTAALLLLLPLPSNTLAEGVIRLPENAILRADESGEVVELLRRDGERVERGEALIRLQQPALTARARILSARAGELRARMEQVQMRDRVETAILREQLTAVEVELTELEQRLDALTLTSPATGELDLVRPDDLPGRYLEKGSVLGLVHGEGAAIASVVIPQTDAGLVRRQTHSVSARFPGRPESESSVTLVADVPSGSYLLPSPALGSKAGGRIRVDSRDERGITALEPIFQYDIRLPQQVLRAIPGARIQVRFEHPPETLASRWYRSLRQLLLSRLGA